ncbi:MAG: family 43 glycosylhydrolase [Clostridia bacterium]|nr:family 43 glycosylhydrolase [Clostridia bacterium]
MKKCVVKREDIRIRDPFILTDNGKYYMYGSFGDTAFSVYVSTDLQNFEGPFTVFEGGKDKFWADRDFWAPEVHKYNGKFYLFGSLKSETRHRGTQIFVSDSPLGEFKPISDFPQTPEEWECLDGTLWVEDGKPYMVFCHEWAQVGDGEICAMPLSDDLSKAIGKPVLLFKASDFSGVQEIKHGNGCKGYITDGPYLYIENGKTKMLWSTFSDGKYATIRSQAAGLFGKWEVEGKLFDFDGGHPMLFTGFDGVRRISIHSPNSSPNERALFLPI